MHFLTVAAPVHPVKEARHWVSLLNIRRARELNTASLPPDLKEHLRTPLKLPQTEVKRFILDHRGKSLQFIVFLIS